MVCCIPYINSFGKKICHDAYIKNLNFHVLTISSSSGELWTGSENGSLRAWPSDVVGRILLPSRILTSLVETSFIDIKPRGTQASASSLSGTDVRFLVAEHSQCCIWSGGSLVLALW